MIIGPGITIGGGIYVDANAPAAPPSALLSYDGSSLTGWTQIDTGAVDATLGNPLPSWKFTSRGMYRDLGFNLLDKTFTFDVRLATNADGGIVFCNNAVGNGAYRAAIRIFQGVNRDQGLRAGSNGGWLYIGAGGTTTSSFPAANTWYNVKLQITSARVCTWYIDGALQASTYTLSSSYTSADTTNNWFGFMTNTSTINYDNFTVYSGLI